MKTLRYPLRIYVVNVCGRRVSVCQLASLTLTRLVWPQPALARFIVVAGVSEWLNSLIGLVTVNGGSWLQRLTNNLCFNII